MLVSFLINHNDKSHLFAKENSVMYNAVHTDVNRYSEGLNDDLNKCVWSGLGEDSRATVDDIVAQYARFFFGAEHEHLAVIGLMGLESAWRGPPNRTTSEQTLDAWSQVRVCFLDV